MKRVLVWETSPAIAGGQKMTLTVMDLLKDECEFLCLIPQEGELSAELHKRGIAYRLMGDQSLPAGVKGKQVYFRYAWMSIVHILRSLAVIGQFKPDVLYAPGPAALPWSAVCGTLSQRPVIWHLHHLFADGPTKKLLNITAGMKSIQNILAVSGCVGDQIHSARGRSKVRVLYNPIDMSKYMNGDGGRVRGEIQNALGLYAAPECILTEIAVIRQAKRQDHFVRIVEALKKKGIWAVGVIAGEAITREDRAFKTELLRQIENSGMQQDIYMAGYRTDVGNVLAASDLVVVPMEVEGLSLAAQEAMINRRDVVVPDTGGAAELLHRAGCGIFYPPDASPDEIAQIILREIRKDRTEQIESGYHFCSGLNQAAYKEKLTQVFLSEDGCK